MVIHHGRPRDARKMESRQLQQPVGQLLRLNVTGSTFCSPSFSQHRTRRDAARPSSRVGRARHHKTEVLAPNCSRIRGHSARRPRHQGPQKRIGAAIETLQNLTTADAATTGTLHQERHAKETPDSQQDATTPPQPTPTLQVAIEGPAPSPLRFRFSYNHSSG